MNNQPLYVPTQFLATQEGEDSKNLDAEIKLALQQARTSTKLQPVRRDSVRTSIVFNPCNPEKLNDTTVDAKPLYHSAQNVDQWEIPGTNFILCDLGIDEPLAEQKDSKKSPILVSLSNIDDSARHDLLKGLRSMSE